MHSCRRYVLIQQNPASQLRGGQGHASAIGWYSHVLCSYVCWSARTCQVSSLPLHVQCTTGSCLGVAGTSSTSAFVRLLLQHASCVAHVCCTDSGERTLSASQAAYCWQELPHMPARSAGPQGGGQQHAHATASQAMVSSSSTCERAS